MVEGYFYSMQDNAEHAISVTTDRHSSTFSSCENDVTGTGSIYDPWSDSTTTYSGLRTLVADGSGRNKDYYSRDAHTTLFGPNSILNRSISVHATTDPRSEKVACCNIEQYDSKEDFLALWVRFLDDEPAVTADDLY